MNPFPVQDLGPKHKYYPRLLKELLPPPLLYYRGSLGDPDELAVGVVGTRKISGYGQSAAAAVAEPLARSGITVVSGLAYGVDAAAHRTALDCGGRTIAVLGSGLDDRTIYPRHHVALAHEILESGGLLLSEYPPGTPALKHHFIARNRIIAGLCLGVAIVECGWKSGALSTAAHAFNQQRTVYAVPGSIYSPTSQGTNGLLKDKRAQAITGGRDILEDLNVPMSEAPAAAENFGLDEAERKILAHTGGGPTPLALILERSGVDPSAAGAALALLEIKGKIRDAGGQQYARTK